MAATRDRGLMGQYAGIVTRGVALIIDILVVIVAVLVISASLSLPLDFFLSINKQSCAANVSMAAQPSTWGFIRSWLCVIYDWLLVAVAFLTGPVYFIFLSTAGGQTVGKYVMGVRIVRVDNRPMSFSKALVRYIGYFVSLATLGVGFLWVVADAQRRALHDHMAGTCVIYSWRAQENYFLVSRIQRLFGRHRTTRDRQAVVSALSTHTNDLVTLAVAGYDDLRNLLRIIQNGRQNGHFALLGLIEYAKSADGRISRIDDAELGADGAEWQRMIDSAGFTRERIDEIQAGIPNDHFALVVIARDDDIDAVVKLVAQRTSALIRRYDLGRQMPVQASAANAPATAPNGAPAPAVRATAAVSATPPAPAAVASRTAQAGDTSAFNARPIRRPSSDSALVPASATETQAAGAPATPAALSDPVEQLQAQKSQIEKQLQMRSQELAALEARFRAADGQLASLRAAYEAQQAETARLRSTSDAANFMRTHSPAIALLEQRVAALPPVKLRAVDEAVTAGVLPRFVDTPQELADIAGIGPTDGQRLYRAGIGTFWEVACLAAADLRALLEISELQATQVNLPEICADARRLAEKSNSIGQIWDGHHPTI